MPTYVGYKPYGFQRDVHNALENPKSKLARIVLVKSRRQCGKSTMIENELLKRAVTCPMSWSAVVSPTLKQSRKMFREIVEAAGKTGFVTGANAQELFIFFRNRSKVHFYSAEQGADALRGYTVTNGGLLCIDEAAFVSDEVFYTVVPWTDVNKADILITSTPKFKTGFFYDYYIRGLAGEPGITVIDWNDEKYKEELDRILSPEKLEQYRKLLPTGIFRSEYLGEFVDDGGGVFPVKNWMSKFEAYNSLYFGIDWGSGEGNDKTAVAGLNERGEQVILQYWNDEPEPMKQIKKIASILRANKSKIKNVLVEKNSIGDVFYKLLKNEVKYDGIKVKPFNTTNSTKREIIEGLSAALGEGNVTLQDEKENRLEFNAYQMEITKGGTVTYNGAYGFNDDLVIATALANKAKVSNYGNYNISYV